jgi:gluconate 2-dehydrogenase gamma chain
VSDLHSLLFANVRTKETLAKIFFECGLDLIFAIWTRGNRDANVKSTAVGTDFFTNVYEEARTKCAPLGGVMRDTNGRLPEQRGFVSAPSKPGHSGVTRRSLLASAALLITTTGAGARVVTKVLPFKPNEAYPVTPVVPGGYLFFTAVEAATVDSIVDRLIPTDDLGAGAKDAGVTTFIDRQLTGPYGGHDWLYMQGPFSSTPLPSQGMQSPLVPRQQYRLGLAALETYCKATFSGRSFVQLNAEEQDRLLAGMEKGEVKFENFSSGMLFSAIYANTMEGFFADPIYGGNRDMAGWKLLGFPGVRYDFRDVMEKPNQAYALPPVSLQGRPAWGER